MQEDLPADFWGDGDPPAAAGAPPQPSPVVAPSVADVHDDDAPDEADTPLGTADTMAALEQLFPGRIIRIEPPDDGEDEAGLDAPPDTLPPQDEGDGPLFG